MKKAIVALSGGIDSAVSAAILKDSGFSVKGVFMKLFPGKKGKVSEIKARKTAKILGIPFSVLTLEKEFKKRVIECFLKDSKKGLTPNPCIVCNKEIKFGLFLEKALKQKADFIATGHYARTKDGRLLKAKDKEKDQSYFLWRLSQKQLKKVIFPIGVHSRQEVEKMAKKFKLPFAGVRKSQEICFIPGTVGEFLKNNLKSKPGQIINARGDVLGKHQALHFYTIGQRKGIELSGGPYYVLDKDFKKNVLIVTKNERDLFKKELYIRQVNWLIGKKPVLPLKINAKIRYRQKASSAKIFKKSNSEFYRLVFDKAQRAVTPGQSVVFYQGSEILGGGIISFY